MLPLNSQFGCPPGLGSAHSLSSTLSSLPSTIFRQLVYLHARQSLCDAESVEYSLHIPHSRSHIYSFIISSPFFFQILQTTIIIIITSKAPVASLRPSLVFLSPLRNPNYSFGYLFVIIIVVKKVNFVFFQFFNLKSPKKNTHSRGLCDAG